MQAESPALLLVELFGDHQGLDEGFGDVEVPTLCGVEDSNASQLHLRENDERMERETHSIESESSVLENLQVPVLASNASDLGQAEELDKLKGMHRPGRQREEGGEELVEEGGAVVTGGSDEERGGRGALRAELSWRGKRVRSSPPS